MTFAIGKAYEFPKSLMCKGVLENVLAHLECFEASGLTVVVYTGVFPSIAEVAFVGEEAY